MTERIEYGSKDAADAARDEFSDHLCTDDDKRLKTVAFAESGTPDDVLEAARRQAEDSKDDGSDNGGGQPPLSDSEKDKIDFSKGRANTLHARSAKGIALNEGVEDWTSYYDPTLTVDEHREVMDRAGRESGSRTAEDSVEEKAGRAARTAQSEQCEHAAGHCDNGDPEACEFLTEVCGYDDDEVAVLLDDQGDETDQQELVTVGGDEYPEIDVTKAEAGALRDSWTGYKSAIGTLADDLEEIREEIINARQSIRAINRIRGQYDQGELHPNRLHELLDAVEAMPGDVPEVRTLDHFAAESDGDDVVPLAEMDDEELAARAPDRPGRPDRPNDLDEQGGQSLPKAPQPQEPVGRPVEQGDDADARFARRLHDLADRYQGWRVTKEPQEPESGRLYARLYYGGHETGEAEVRVLTHDTGSRTYQAKGQVSHGEIVHYDDTIENGDRDEVADRIVDFFEASEENVHTADLFRPYSDPSDVVHKADEPEKRPGQYAIRDPADSAPDFEHVDGGDEVLVSVAGGPTVAGTAYRYHGDQINVEAAGGETYLVSLAGMTREVSHNGEILGYVDSIRPLPSLSKAPQRPAAARSARPARSGTETGAVETADTFANEGQSQLGGVGVEAEEGAGDDRQVTLTGENEADSTGALPPTWNRRGTNWEAGPYRVQIGGDRHAWHVRLFGPNESFEIASGLPDAPEAEAVAREFTARVAPDDVTMSSSDPEMMEAAAAAKRDALDDDGGLHDYT